MGIVPKQYSLICPQCKLVYGPVWTACRFCNINLVDSRPYLIFNLVKKVLIPVMLLLVIFMAIYISQPLERKNYFESYQLFLKGNFQECGNVLKESFLRNPIFRLIDRAKAQFNENKTEETTNKKSHESTSVSPLHEADGPIISMEPESNVVIEVKKKEWYE